MKPKGAIVTPIAATPAAPGLGARIAAGFSYVFTGRHPFFPPLEPLAPEAPPETAGRQFDYPTGINLVVQPRSSGEIGFHQLRALADSYDLMRLVIETRKDQLVKLRWDVARKDRQKADDPRIAEVRDFLAYPDREHSWDQWIRMLIEDLLVIDAPAIYPRRTLGGALYSLDPIDGATIKRVLDTYGRTPAPPAPAYQQILKGLPAVDYTTDELWYLPRNPRTNRIYGMSPVEQVVMSVNIAIRRQLHQLEFYTAGTVPEALLEVPADWTPQQIAEFQDYFDGLLTDSTAERRKVRFVPAGLAKGFVQTKQGVLKDEYDEWLARIVCYAFSVSPQWAVKQMNRASAEQASESAEEEGLAPLQTWIKSVIDRALLQGWGYGDLELLWLEDQEQDALKQAQVAEIYVKLGAINLDEVRGDIGRDPLPNGIGQVNMIYTGAGAIPVEVAIKPPEPPPQLAPGAGGAPGEEEGDEAEQQEALAKAADRRDARRMRMQKLWEGFLGQAGKRIGAALARHLALSKGAGDPEDPEQPKAPDQTQPDQAAEPPGGEEAASPVDAAIDAALAAEPWHHVEAESSAILQEDATAAAADAVAQGGAEAGISVARDGLADALNLANPRAVAAAQEQAADLVKGIDEVTRKALRDLVAQAQDEGWSTDRLAKAIEEAAAFGKDRSFLIANTELARSSIAGNLAGMRAMNEQWGLGLKKRTILGMNENHCPACLAAFAEGPIPLDQGFAGMGDPPFHPNCGCGLVPVVPERGAK